MGYKLAFAVGKSLFAKKHKSAKVLLRTLADYANDETGYCFPCKQTILDESLLDPHTFCTALKILENLGWIQKKREDRKYKYQLNVKKLEEVFNEYYKLHPRKDGSYRTWNNTSVIEDSTANKRCENSHQQDVKSNINQMLKSTSVRCENPHQEIYNITNNLNEKGKEKLNPPQDEFINKNSNKQEIYKQERSVKDDTAINNEKGNVYENIAKSSSLNFQKSDSKNKPITPPIKEKVNNLKHKLSFDTLPSRWREIAIELDSNLNPEELFKSFRFYYTEGKKANHLATDKSWNQAWYN